MTDSITRPMTARRWICLTLLLFIGGACAESRPFADQGEGADPEIMRPKGSTRTIDFITEEGTWMSVDVSPDGRWIAFDLLGHIYRMPASGGEAVALTQGSGIALNFHPSYSQDGSRIAFISDRSGQNNVWVMDADGANPRPAILDEDTRFTDPTWSPDGTSVVAVRIYPTPGRGWHRRTMTLWRLPLDGTEAAPVKEDRGAHYTAPSFGPDGSLYYQAAYSTWFGKGMLKAGHRIQRQPPGAPSENVRLLLPAVPTEEYQAALDRTLWAEDVEGDESATLSPEPSPDGRWLAFAQEVQGETFTYRGHEYQPKTAMFVRNLNTGEERRILDPAPKDMTRVNAQYSYRVFPGYSWTPDSRSIVIAQGGKIRRVNVQSGEQDVIPFRARVHREISEQVRGRVDISDGSVPIEFIQWPAGSPTSDAVAFVAAGRIWMSGPGGETPRPLTADMLPHFQLTPAWSPDGNRLAFTTWHDVLGGHLWTTGKDGGEATQVSDVPRAYYHPAWSADGAQLFVAALDLELENERILAQRNPWNDPLSWKLVSFPASGGSPTELAALGAHTAPHLGVDGRVRFTRQKDPLAAAELYQPFPPESATDQTVVLESVDPGTGAQARLAAFPATMGRIGSMGARNEPLLSPDGRWIAHRVDFQIHVTEAEALGEGVVPLDLNEPFDGRVRADSLGGAYHRWRSPTVLEFASGNRYHTYDAVTGERSTTPIDLTVPRPLPPGRIAFTGARIVTVGSAGVLESADVVVEGSRISCVGDCDTSDADRVIDATGKTIIPGLVDLHAHHTGEGSGVVPQHRPASALALAYGVTTAIDPAGEELAALPLGQMIDAGVIVGPRTYTSGTIVITSGLGWGDRWEIEGQEQAEYQVARRADWGAITIKNYRQGRREQHQQIIEAARRHGTAVTSEGGPLYFDIGLMMDGQTGWEHLIAKLPIYSDASRFLGAAGAHYSPTAIVAGHIDGSMEYYRPRQGLLEDPKYNRFIPRAALEGMHAANRDLEKSHFSYPIIAEGMADIVRAGGYGAIGEHGNQPGMGEHWELWGYAEALTPLEAITVGTLHGAHFVGLDHEIGSIEEGKLADLILLNSNPLDDIQNSIDIDMVMKGGFLYDASTLAGVWPEETSYGPVPWQLGWP